MKFKPYHSLFFLSVSLWLAFLAVDGHGNVIFPALLSLGNLMCAILVAVLVLLEKSYDN